MVTIKLGGPLSKSFGPKPSAKKSPWTGVGLETHAIKHQSYFGELGGRRLLRNRWLLHLFGRFVIQHVFLDYFEVAVFAWNIAVFEGDQDRLAILAIKPLLRL